MALGLGHLLFLSVPFSLNQGTGPPSHTRSCPERTRVLGTTGPVSPWAGGCWDASPQLPRPWPGRRSRARAPLSGLCSSLNFFVLPEAVGDYCHTPTSTLAHGATCRAPSRLSVDPCARPRGAPAPATSAREHHTHLTEMGPHGTRFSVNFFT